MKRQSVDSLTEHLGKLKFLPVAQKTWGAKAHYFRHAPNGLILNLGVETSKLYSDRFTGSYYLGPSFTWALMWPSFPRNAYERVGAFLRPAERRSLLEAEFQSTIDAWWIGSTPEN